MMHRHGCGSSLSGAAALLLILAQGAEASESRSAPPVWVSQTAYCSSGAVALQTPAEMAPRRPARPRLLDAAPPPAADQALTLSAVGASMRLALLICVLPRSAEGTPSGSARRT